MLQKLAKTCRAFTKYSAKQWAGHMLIISFLHA